MPTQDLSGADVQISSDVDDDQVNGIQGQGNQVTIRNFDAAQYNAFSQVIRVLFQQNDILQSYNHVDDTLSLTFDKTIGSSGSGDANEDAGPTEEVKVYSFSDAQFAASKQVITALMDTDVLQSYRHCDETLSLTFGKNT